MAVGNSSFRIRTVAVALFWAISSLLLAGDYEVYLISGFETVPSVSPGHSNAFFARFNSPNTDNTVLIDIELLNSSNQKVAQAFWDNVTIKKGGVTSLPGPFSAFSPASLPVGTYHWAVGIFKPGWSGLIMWRGFVASFMVIAPGQAGDIVIQSQEFQNILGFNALAVQFSNAGPTKTITLDLELFNSASQRIGQVFINGVEFYSGTSISLKLNATNVSGTYTYKAGVFSAGTPTWGSLLQWYNDLWEFEAEDEPSDLGLDSATFTPGDQVAPSVPVSATVFFRSQSPPSKTVILDVELYNTANQKIGQAFQDNVVFTSTDAIGVTLAFPSGLPAGTYILKAGVFNQGSPEWGSLIYWYDSVGQLIVAP